MTVGTKLTPNAANVLTWVATQQHYFAIWFTGRPDAPQDVKVVPSSQTVSVNVSWTPGYSGGYDQQFSIHYRKKGSGSDFTEEFIGLPPNNMHTVQQLSPATEYELMMQASNQRGNSPTSPLVQVTTSGNKEITFVLSIRTVIKWLSTWERSGEFGIVSKPSLYFLWVKRT